MVFVAYSVPLEVFRKALETGGFVTMRDAWKQNKEEEGEEARIKKQSELAACALEEYPECRVKVLNKFELNREHFEVLVDPGNQSSEYSDSKDMSLYIVQEPAFCIVIKLLAAFNVGFKAEKKKASNQQLTKFKYRAIHVPVPKLNQQGPKYP
ncbi:hypothetical protein FRC12_003380 [Ceratobasidium sp. 428]|nr:hypothetical protein FRC12_003380 [Ceratobasidium sp. 428]